MLKIEAQLSAVHKERACADDEKHVLRRLLHEKEVQCDYYVFLIYFSIFICTLVQELIERHILKQKELQSIVSEHQAEIEVLDEKVKELTMLNESLETELQRTFENKIFPVSRYCCICVCVCVCSFE